MSLWSLRLRRNLTAMYPATLYVQPQKLLSWTEFTGMAVALIYPANHIKLIIPVKPLCANIT